MTDYMLFNLPVKIYMGDSILDKLKETAGWGKKAFLVTGRNFALGTGLLQKAEALLKEAGVGTSRFTEVEPEPCVETAEKGAKACKDAGCDCVVGIGGGSPLDTAKAIAILATNAGSLRDYFGEEKFPNDPLPVIAVPTTAGTGSEVARYAVMVDWSIPGKKTISSYKILPKISILDPSLTITLTKELTVFTGMDAFSHSLEGYMSTGANPLSDLFAVESMKNISRNLLKVLSKPGDAGLRGSMLYASMLAGMVINKTGTIIVHGMAYPLALGYRLKHGQTNAMLLSSAIAYLYPHYREKLILLEKELGADIRAVLERLVKGTGVSFRLRDCGVLREDIDKLAQEAVGSCERAMKRMKVTLGADDFRKIYEKAF